jgi:hypothetical protein
MTNYRQDLIGYFLALHNQLEKEFNYSMEDLATMGTSELKRRTKRLADHLLLTPAGEDGVDKARNDTQRAYRWLVRVSG